VIEAWGFGYSTCGSNWVTTNARAGTRFAGPAHHTACGSEVRLVGLRGRWIEPAIRLAPCSFLVLRLAMRRQEFLLSTWSEIHGR